MEKTRFFIMMFLVVLHTASLYLGFIYTEEINTGFHIHKKWTLAMSRVKFRPQSARMITDAAQHS
jgi:hypothetical protein